jgi:hypothetical protein
MGRIEFGARSGFGKSSNTRAEFSRDCTQEEVGSTLEQFSCAQVLADGNKVALIYGMGARPRSVYRMLERDSGVKVVGYRSLLTGFCAIARPIVASYEGIVCVQDPARLQHVFLTLMDSSMVTLYFFEKSMLARVTQAIWAKTPTRVFDFGVKADSGYLIYSVDADNRESKTGLHEIISYGFDTPSELLLERIRN